MVSDVIDTRHDSGKKLEKKIIISGHAIHEGKILSPENPIFSRLNSISEYCQFAQNLRGQFSILVQEGNCSIAVTDPFCSYPIYRLEDGNGHSNLLATRIAHLLPYSKKKIRKLALFKYIMHSGIGLDTLYSDISILPQAVVVRAEPHSFFVKSYFEWKSFLEERQTGMKEAKNRLVEIASGFLNSFTSHYKSTGCFLSSGTDSALVACLIKEITGTSPACFSADHFYRRYSEFSDTKLNAEKLNLELQRVLISGNDFVRSFHALNGSNQDRPCGHSTTSLFHKMSAEALRCSTHCVFTGFNADDLFFGFDFNTYFRGLPESQDELHLAISQLSASDKLSRLVSEPTITPDTIEWLAALRLSQEEYWEWLKANHAQSLKYWSDFVESERLPVLLQLRNQIWTGISWQHVFWPVEQCLDVHFVSPFYDIEMIKFGLSLPLEAKFCNGVSKVILRDLLKDRLGSVLPKRAGPNPSRIWSMFPGYSSQQAIAPFLRSFYNRSRFRNMFQLGKNYGKLLKLAALGRWLKSQGISIDDLLHSA